MVSQSIETAPDVNLIYKAAIQTNADRYGVSSQIHPDDHIFNFVFGHPKFGKRQLAIDYYFGDGNNSAKQFLSLLSQHLPAVDRPSVLEFASGYGCVTRHLGRDPSIDLESCDIHPAAVRFIADAIGTPCLPSSSCPEDLVLPKTYDAVFALSFFSHMPVSTWARWLVRLIAAARVGGLIMFTTHGLASRKHFGNPEMPDLGFWFRTESEQADLPVNEYGQTIVTPAFVKQNIASMPLAELIETREAFWWGHQDLYVLRRK